MVRKMKSSFDFIKNQNMDRKTTLIKTSIWFLIALALSVLVVWGFTDDVEIGIYVALVSNFGKAILYYGYERTWLWCNRPIEPEVVLEMDLP
jgi:uncharacterized membrane protein